MSKPLTIDHVLNEVLKNSNVANVTVSLWKGACVPGPEVTVWDGSENYRGKTLSEAFASYVAAGAKPQPATDTAEEALRMIEAPENPTSAQEEANYHNSL